MYTVYVLSSVVRDYLYVGLTSNLGRRYREHQSGWERTTRPYKPFKIVYLEQFATRNEARRREKYLKSGGGKEWLKTNIKNVDMGMWRNR